MFRAFFESTQNAQSRKRDSGMNAHTYVAHSVECTGRPDPGCLAGPRLRYARLAIQTLVLTRTHSYRRGKPRVVSAFARKGDEAETTRWSTAPVHML